MNNKSEVWHNDFEEQTLPSQFDEETIINKDSKSDDSREIEDTNSEHVISNKTLDLTNVQQEKDSEAQSMPADQSLLESTTRFKSDSIDSSIKTTDTLSDGAVAAIDDAVEKFKSNGNAADFYNVARTYMEDNLQNSYNRKLGK